MNPAVVLLAFGALVATVAGVLVGHFVLFALGDAVRFFAGAL